MNTPEAITRSDQEPLREPIENPLRKTPWRWWQSAALFLAALFILVGLFGAFVGLFAGNPKGGDTKGGVSFIDWFVPLWIGLMFTLMAALKLYGLSKGVVGGAEKPFMTRLCGT